MPVCRRYELYLTAFAGYGTGTIINNPAFFKGCGDNTPQQLASFEVRNYGQSDRLVCMDDIELI